MPSFSYLPLTPITRNEVLENVHLIMLLLSPSLPFRFIVTPNEKHLNKRKVTAVENGPMRKMYKCENDEALNVD